MPDEAYGLVLVAADGADDSIVGTQPPNLQDRLGQRQIADIPSALDLAQAQGGPDGFLRREISESFLERTTWLSPMARTLRVTTALSEGVGAGA